MIISIWFCASLLAGCGGGGGGGGGSSSASTSTFLDESTTYTYNASLDNTWVARQEYKNVAQYVSDSSIHPYTLIGVNYAYGMGLSGTGKTIAIMDTKFRNSSDLDHGEFSDKTITKYNALTAGGSNSTNYHGMHVAGLAAAGYHDNSASFVTSNTNTSDWSTNNTNYLRNPNTGAYPSASYPLLNYGMMGVAYNADLHFTDWAGINLNAFALATTSAKNTGAIAQNNSWGWGACQTNNCSQTIDVWVNNQITWGYSDAQTLAALTDNEAGWTTYLSALNNFQNTGVVVVSAGNDSTNSEVNVQAGLPQIATELAEAWLVVGNIDTTGSTVTSSSITRYGNQCGITAAYCVQADGVQVTSSVGGWGGSNETGMYQSYTGTSMAAPIVSGAIALLSEAFPNHTPAQLVDRILASANNDFFTSTDTTSFVNGITHGYNSEFGHGIVDLEVALKPIQTSSMIPPTGREEKNSGNISSAKRFALTETTINLSPAFGDSLERALTGKTAYFYDSLNGGFAIDFTSLIGTSSRINKITHPIDYIREEAELTTVKNALGFTMVSEIPSNSDIQDSGFLMLVPGPKDTIGFTGQNINLQNALSFSEDNGIAARTIESGNPFAIPFISASEQGSVAGLSSKFMAGKILLGFFEGESHNYQLQTKGLIASYGLGVGGSRISMLSGATIEDGGLLDSAIAGGFGETSFANTKFTGMSAQGELPGGWYYNAMATLGRTDLEIEGVSLLHDVKNILSSAFAFEIQRSVGFAENDNLHLTISQPVRVEAGRATIYIPQLYQTGGNLRFEELNFDLAPSGRQIDFGVGYTASISDKLTFDIQSALMHNSRHIKSDALDYSLTGTLKFKF